MTTIHVLSVLTRDMGLSSPAAKCVLSHGQVYLDERQLGMADKVIDLDETPGEFLHVVSRSKRIAWPTPADIPLEAALDVDPTVMPPHNVSCQCPRCDEWWSAR